MNYAKQIGARRAADGDRAAHALYMDLARAARRAGERGSAALWLRRASETRESLAYWLRRC